MWQEQLSFKNLSMFKIGKARDIIFMVYHEIQTLNYKRGTYHFLVLSEIRFCQNG